MSFVRDLHRFLVIFAIFKHFNCVAFFEAPAKNATGAGACLRLLHFSANVQKMQQFFYA